jgi:polyferredoxin
VPDLLKRTLDTCSSRMFVRTAFLVFFVFISVQLLRFVAWARGAGDYVPRPEAVAGLLPVGHYTSFFAWVRGGGWDVLLPAGLVIILGALALSLAFKRGFCGWMCPLGTVWEWAAIAGRKLIGRTVKVPRWLDIAGRSFRYLISGAILLWLLRVPLSEAVGFRELPYMWVADVKILQGFASPVMIGVLAIGWVVSMIFGPVWCRYLCPLGGWYGALSTLSPCGVTRDAEACIECGKCTKSCHTLVDVEHAGRVRVDTCDGCMDCVRACPVDGALTARAFGRLRIRAWVWPLLVVGLWLAIYGGAKLTGNWDTAIPADTFRQVIGSGILESKTPGGL